MATLYAGTSGFAYQAWKPGFYPDKLPAARFLEHYSGRLNGVEINYTFRHMPSASTLANWVKATRPGFEFAVKAHQTITHSKRLKDEAREPTEYFLKALWPLREAQRLGPVLFQLPPNLKLDRDRLAAYLDLLPNGMRYTFEFRHESWFTDEVFELLKEHDASLCLAESETLQVPDVVTAGFVYFRLRKPDYSSADLARLAARSHELLAAGRDVYLMFKHEETPAGALDAERMLREAA
jgi:uncharacterized protein YecE (DUF72 family)